MQQPRFSAGSNSNNGPGTYLAGVSLTCEFGDYHASVAADGFDEFCWRCLISGELWDARLRVVVTSVCEDSDKLRLFTSLEFIGETCSSRSAFINDADWERYGRRLHCLVCDIATPKLKVGEVSILRIH
ncbi:hypothetical protein TMatcc_007639 [Talaromyces marneffei ATCC 18224]